MEGPNCLQRAFAIALITCMLLGSAVQEARAAGPKDTSIEPILDTLGKAKLSGSLEVSGRCSSMNVQDFPEFPAVHLPVTSAGSSLQKLRAILASDPIMQVSQSPSGMIRMVETGVPTDLLEVKIKHISFNVLPSGAAYQPNVALSVILRAPEIVDFMAAHNIEWPFHGEAVSGSGASWPAQSPHISGSLDNLTLSDALDIVLRTFPGIWIYESCPRSSERSRFVYLRFFYLRKIGSGAPFVDE